MPSLIHLLSDITLLLAPDRNPAIGPAFASATFCAICFVGSGNPLLDHGTQPHP